MNALSGNKRPPYTPQSPVTYTEGAQRAECQGSKTICSDSFPHLPYWMIWKSSYHEFRSNLNLTLKKKFFFKEMMSLMRSGNSHFTGVCSLSHWEQTWIWFFLQGTSCEQGLQMLNRMLKSFTMLMFGAAIRSREQYYTGEREHHTGPSSSI